MYEREAIHLLMTVPQHATITFGMSASAATMSDLMKYLPADAQIAVGLPDIQAVETAGAPLLEVGPLSEISNLAWELGGDTLSEGLTESGINAAAPGVVFLNAPTQDDVRVCGVLMVADEAKVKETLANLLSGEGTEITLPGEIKGRNAGEASYFINDGKLFVASNETLLQQLATRIAEPADIKYETKDEVVLWSRIDIIENSGLLNLTEEMAYVKPLINTLKPFTDEVLLAIGENAGQAYVRAAARDNTPEGAVSRTQFAWLYGRHCAGVANLHHTHAANAIAMTLTAIPETRQIAGYVRIASSLLGDEMAVSLRGEVGKSAGYHHCR